LITIGACATAGGIQALRNFGDVEEFRSVIYASPQYIDTLATSMPISAHVPVNFELPGRLPDQRHATTVPWWNGLRLKKAGNAILEAVCGRAIHPVNPRVGGFYRAPTQAELAMLAEQLRPALDDALATAAWVAGQVPHSTALHATPDGGSYLAGRWPATRSTPGSYRRPPARPLPMRASVPSAATRSAASWCAPSRSSTRSTKHCGSWPSTSAPSRHRPMCGLRPESVTTSARHRAACSTILTSSTRRPDRRCRHRAAIRLAEALDRAPQRLVVFAVEAADVGFGLGLSPAVAAPLPELTRAVRSELGLGAPAAAT
jgi:hypothetical protein